MKSKTMCERHGRPMSEDMPCRDCMIESLDRLGIAVCEIENRGDYVPLNEIMVALQEKKARERQRRETRRARWTVAARGAGYIGLFYAFQALAGAPWPVVLIAFVALVLAAWSVESR